MGEKLKRIGEVWAVDRVSCFRLDFIKKMERRFWSTTPDMGAVLKRGPNLEFIYCQ